MNKAVFLDRDGVLNQPIIVDGKPKGPKTPEEFVINPDIQELARLKQLGYLLVVVTNQPGVADGLVTRAFVDDLHARLSSAFAFDDIIVCFHNGKDHCDCRKPKPGMFYQARDKFKIDLSQSYMVGDRWRDMLAGHAAGCSTVFIDYGYTEDAPEFSADFTCNSLKAAVDWIEISSR